LEERWPCPVFANYILAFALQLREKYGKTSVRVAEEIQRDSSSNFLMYILQKTTRNETILLAGL
jgi:hypothetical protein